MKGFTLIELLIGIAIMSAIAIISTQMLWDTVSVRSKQQTIEDSSDNIRQILSKITKNIVSAKQIVSVSDYKLQLVDNSDKCIEFNINSNLIEEKYYSTSACTEASANSTLSASGVIISNQTDGIPVFTNNSNVISINIKGKYKDNLGEHPFLYTTTAAPRIYL